MKRVTLLPDGRVRIEKVDGRRKPKRACPKGHEYAGANVGVSATGKKVCRACDRERKRALAALKPKAIVVKAPCARVQLSLSVPKCPPTVPEGHAGKRNLSTVPNPGLYRETGLGQGQFRCKPGTVPKPKCPPKEKREYRGPVGGRSTEVMALDALRRGENSVVRIDLRRKEGLFVSLRVWIRGSGGRWHRGNFASQGVTIASAEVQRVRDALRDALILGDDVVEPEELARIPRGTLGGQFGDTSKTHDFELHVTVRPGVLVGEPEPFVEIRGWHVNRGAEDGMSKGIRLMWVEVPRVKAALDEALEAMRRLE